MPLSSSGLNTAVNAVKGQANYVSLHSADPGAAGDNEITGGSPAYARKSVSWGSATNGVASISASVQFDVPSGVTITHFGFWTSTSGGTFVGGEALRDAENNPVSENYASQGLYTLTNATLTVANP